MAREKNKMFKKFFYEKSRQYGWSRNVLTRPGEWYTELLEDGNFSPRSVRHDAHECWYKIHTWKFKEECYPVSKIEDIKEVPEGKPYDGKATGIVNLNVFCLECECFNIILFDLQWRRWKNGFPILRKTRKNFKIVTSWTRKNFSGKGWTRANATANVDKGNEITRVPQRFVNYVISTYSYPSMYVWRIYPYFHLFCSPRLVRRLQRKTVLPRFENCPSRMLILLL